MAVHHPTVYVCDFCPRKRESETLPKGWSVATDYYGNETHACTRDGCSRQLKGLAEEYGLTYHE